MILQADSHDVSLVKSIIVSDKNDSSSQYLAVPADCSNCIPPCPANEEPWNNSFSNLSAAYLTGHSPTISLLHLCHSSFSNPSFASSTSQALHLRHLTSLPWHTSRFGYWQYQSIWNWEIVDKLLQSYFSSQRKLVENYDWSLDMSYVQIMFGKSDQIYLYIFLLLYYYYYYYYYR